MKIPSQNKKIILNVDTGTDDALALILAHRYLKNIIGITTSAGNVVLSRVNTNTNKVLNLVGAEINIYSGAKKDLKDEEFQLAEDFHGADGLVGVDLPLSKDLKQKKSAVDFIVEEVNKNPGKVIIVSLAPMTNVALALKKDPSIAKKVDKILIMGGTLEVEGNETPKTEFNFYQDPESVKIVFDSNIESYLVTLDVTNKCLISEKTNQEFKTNPIANFTRQIIENWYHLFGRKHNRKYELYDPLAIGVLIDDFVEFKKIPLDIITDGPMRGALKQNGKNQIFVSIGVKSKKFKQFFINSINNHK